MVPSAETILVDRAAAQRVGRYREPLPLVLTDALARFDPDDQATLLDVVARLGETTQVIYLTDDPATLAWSATRPPTA